MKEFKEFEELEKMLKKLYGIALARPQGLRLPDGIELPAIALDKDAIFYGFSRIVKPDGTEEVRTFGNFMPEGIAAGEEDPNHETLVDVIVDRKRKEVVVTAELPGFERDDIKVKTAEKRVEIHAEKDGMKYHKTLLLEVEIEPKSTEIKLNNGVLEIKSTLKK